MYIKINQITWLINVPRLTVNDASYSSMPCSCIFLMQKCVLCERTRIQHSADLKQGHEGWEKVLTKNIITYFSSFNQIMKEKKSHSASSPAGYSVSL